jgi:hypothetical protein
MSRRRFKPIGPPPKVSYPAMSGQPQALQSRSDYDGDLARRLLALFADTDPERWLAPSREGGTESLKPRSDQNPTDADWRRLALLLAIKHGEPGFTIDPGVKQGRRAADDEIRRDQLMDSLIYGEPNTTEGETNIRLGKRKLMTAVEASKRAYKMLTDKRVLGSSGKRVPSAEAIRSQYSARVAAKRMSGKNTLDYEIPTYMQFHLAWRSAFSALEHVSEAITRQKEDGTIPADDRAPDRNAEATEKG